MPPDYVTLLTALVIAYQSTAPEWTTGLMRGVPSSAVVAAMLGVLWVVPWLSFSGIRWGWCMGGLLLMGFAWRHMIQRRPMPLWLIGIDAAASWIALALTGAPNVAVACGAAAGTLLPCAVGPWPRAVHRLMRPLGVMLTGAMGLRLLLKALGGGVAWPLFLLLVPWLILWDVRSAYDATSRLAKR